MHIDFGINPASIAAMFACKHADESMTRHEKRLEAMEDLEFQTDLAMTQYYVRGLLGMGAFQSEMPGTQIDNGFGRF